MRSELLDEALADDLAAASMSLAKALNAGATLWSVAPAWEAHAHHVAVEFVHPVIVGKRAFPAAALVGADPVAQARVAARPGDVILVVATAADPVAKDLLLRAQAWGVRTIWIGYADRPDPGAANHVLWVDSADPMTPATGGFVLLYHLLWELTHVCFEHPGLLVQEDDGCADDVCITCSDEGRLVEVVAVPDADGDPGQLVSSALARSAAGEEQIDVTLVGEVAVGDLLLVHAGSALTRVGGP